MTCGSQLMITETADQRPLVIQDGVYRSRRVKYCLDHVGWGVRVAILMSLRKFLRSLAGLRQLWRALGVE